MVSRITPEGSKLFSADIIVENEGALTADMVASATVTVNGETVYPYEAGKLEYYRTGDLMSTVDGTVISSNLVDYLQVSAGPGAGAHRRRGERERDLHHPAEPGHRPGGAGDCGGEPGQLQRRGAH